ncbi:phosphatidylinositol N-acetylglucosaminyltransferase subunit P, partial [Cajanus cajan]|uniref:phosphatidylinositol N-acetylglucosaminyltransferase subunit P n=1 Tax=Cajanus cajan TaxID=3821 RepID=UPI0010FB2B73
KTNNIYVNYGKSKNKKNPESVETAEGNCVFSDKTSSFGPKPSEVDGFVGSITTLLVTVIFLVWAYVPESWLQFFDISYYPCSSSRSISLVNCLMLGRVASLHGNATSTIFILSTTLHPNIARCTPFFTDEFSRDPLSLEFSLEDEKPIKPISDIGIDRINDIMFNNAA